MGYQDDGARLSRSGVTSPLGKNAIEVKTAIPEEAADALAGMAVLVGKTKSEYLRDVVMEHLYGRFNALRMSQGHRPVNGE